MSLVHTLLPEIVLLLAAAGLFVLGASKTAVARRASPVVALLALVVAFVLAVTVQPAPVDANTASALTGDAMATYVKAVATGVSVLFVLLAWPSSADGSSNRSISFGTETGEYFALLLLAVTGVCVAGGAASLPTLFLGFELASIPTYVMVTMSRPQEVAQEAGIKYFFLGAASSAVLLLGVAYLFGATGEVRFDKAAAAVHAVTDQGVVPSTVTLAIVLMVLGFGFKLAAVPLHFYAGDVYQGAATPVTAAISFIPKVTALVAILKVLHVAGGGTWTFDPKVLKLLWIVAVLTMSVGNVLALMQTNVKRVLAYSSVAHSGYILVGVAALAATHDLVARQQGLASVGFYVAAYGVMNAAAFGVLMLLPAAVEAPATTAETYEDLSGAALAHPGLGLAMTLACLSLIGVPATVGFFGKLYVLRPAILSGQSSLLWLAVITMINAAVSAGYYLRIVAAMWMPTGDVAVSPVPAERSLPVRAAVTLSAVLIVVFGVVLPLTSSLFVHSQMAGATLVGGR